MKPYLLLSVVVTGLAVIVVKANQLYAASMLEDEWLDDYIVADRLGRSYR